MGKTGAITKQRLLDTATELIWKNSYGAVSVDEICKQAKVMKGSFYYYFPSKISLALAVMDEMLNHAKLEIEPLFITSEDVPSVRFEKWVDFIYSNQEQIFHKYGRVCGCPFATLCSEIADESNGLCNKFVEFRIWYQDCFSKALTELRLSGNLSSTTEIFTLTQEIFTNLMGYLVIARITNDLSPLLHSFKPWLIHSLKMDI